MSGAKAYAADCELAYRLAPMLALWDAEATRARRRKARLMAEDLANAQAAERVAWEAYAATPLALPGTFDAAREAWDNAYARLEEVRGLAKEARRNL